MYVCMYVNNYMHAYINIASFLLNSFVNTIYFLIVYDVYFLLCVCVCVCVGVLVLVDYKDISPVYIPTL